MIGEARSYPPGTRSARHSIVPSGLIAHESESTRLFEGRGDVWGEGSDVAEAIAGQVQFENGERQGSEILLMPNVLVRGDHHCELGGGGHCQERAVHKVFLAPIASV